MNPQNLQSDLANQKLAQFKQECAETQSIREYQIERQQKLQRQRELELKERQVQKLKQQTINRDSNSNTPSLSRGEDDSQEINLICTFYTASADEGSGTGLTASGKVIKQGMIASNSFDFGTKIYTKD